MAGRRPTPTKLKLVRGNPGRRPLNDREPHPKPGMSDPPDHLSEVARDAWEKVATLLSRMGLLTEADCYALERLAECYAEILECKAAIKEHGRTYTSNKVAPGGEGTDSIIVRPRPEVGMLADADRRFKGYLIEFGLTPAARTKVRLDAQQEDDLSEFFG